MLYVVREKVEKKKNIQKWCFESLKRFIHSFQTVIKISSLTSYCSLNSETGKARKILYIYCICTVYIL